MASGKMQGVLEKLCNVVEIKVMKVKGEKMSCLGYLFPCVYLSSWH